MCQLKNNLRLVVKRLIRILVYLRGRDHAINHKIRAWCRKQAQIKGRGRARRTDSSEDVRPIIIKMFYLNLIVFFGLYIN